MIIVVEPSGAGMVSFNKAQPLALVKAAQLPALPAWGDDSFQAAPPEVLRGIFLSTLVIYGDALFASVLAETPRGDQSPDAFLAEYLMACLADVPALLSAALGGIELYWLTDRTESFTLAQVLFQADRSGWDPAATAIRVRFRPSSTLRGVMYPIMSGLAHALAEDILAI